MAKVLGIGGVFFKSRDPEGLAAWYAKWLAVPIEPSFGGSVFHRHEVPEGSYTVWAPFKASTDYFNPSDNPYMINFIVDDLAEALKQVERGGATPAGEPQELAYGHFG